MQNRMAQSQTNYDIYILALKMGWQLFSVFLSSPLKGERFNSNALCNASDGHQVGLQNWGGFLLWSSPLQDRFSQFFCKYSIILNPLASEFFAFEILGY